MADRISFDTSELRALAADMSAIPDRLQRHVYPVVQRGANNIKREIQRNYEASKSFSPIARAVRYEMHQTNFAGTAAVEAEIGPMVGGGGRRRSGITFNEADFGGGRGSAAPLAHIAVHGSPRGGGGNVSDPQVALDNEAPNFAKALGDLLEDLL